MTEARLLEEAVRLAASSGDVQQAALGAFEARGLRLVRVEDTDPDARRRAWRRGIVIGFGSGTILTAIVAIIASLLP